MDIEQAINHQNKRRQFHLTAYMQCDEEDEQLIYVRNGNFTVSNLDAFLFVEDVSASLSTLSSPADNKQVIIFNCNSFHS